MHTTHTHARTLARAHIQTHTKRRIHTPTDTHIINKDLTSITKMKDKVLLNRPIYLGFSILDLSKITMYRFHYQQIVAKYGCKEAKLAYTDTGSFVYLIETKNIYDDMAAHIDAFDTSDFPKTLPLHSKENAKPWGSLKMIVVLFNHTNLSDFEARCIP